MRALVKAAKVMVIAARPTQMPVLAGGGDESLTRRESPSAGTRFRQPPLPEPWLGKRSRSSFGGSWIVVAILLLLLPLQNELLFFVRAMNVLRRGLHYEVAAGALDAVLIRIVINDGHLVTKVAVGRRSGCAPFERCAFPGIVVRGRCTPESAVDQVVNENELGKAGEQGRNRDELMHGDQGDKVIVGEGLVAAHVAGDSE